MKDLENLKQKGATGESPPKDGLNIKVFEEDKPYDTKLTTIKHMNQLLKPPFRLSVVGSTGAGKTNLIKNFIFHFYKNYFDEFYFFLGSKDEQELFEDLSRKHLVKKKKKKKQNMEDKYFNTKENDDKPQDDYDEKINIISRFNDTELSELMDDIENDEDHPRVLMLFDDMIFSNISNRHKLNSLDRLFMNGRHANISVIIASQKYTALNMSSRCINTSMMVLFGLNDKELKTCSEEHSNNITPNEFIQLYKKTTQEPYTFLAVNYQKKPKERFYDSKFNTIL